MTKTDSLFIDPALEKRFREEGYVKVPLLSAIEADKLAELFNRTRAEHESVNTLHHTTTDTQNKKVISEVDVAIKKAFAPALNGLLHNYKPLAGCFHVKQPGTGSATGTHQDPTFVDEDNFVSANVWVALHDMNDANGNLYFIPGSNKIPCLRITPSSPTYYANFVADLVPMSVSVPMKKGEAVIFYNGTIHGATDNVSNDLRLAATLLVCSQPADWLLYYRDSNNKNGEIEKYLLDFDTFVTMPKNGRPNKAALKELIHYNFPVLTKQEFEKAIKPQRPNRNMLSWVMSIFGKQDV